MLSYGHNANVNGFKSIPIVERGGGEWLGCPGGAGCEREADGVAETGGGERGVGICLYYIAPCGDH